MTDQSVMSDLIQKAEQSSEKEVPMGALIMKNNEILAQSANQREIKNSPLGHAEINVIEKACQLQNTWRLLDTTLYVLIEPCLMCTGTIYAARIPRVVFGVTNPKGGSLLHVQENRKKLGLNHSVEIVYGFFEKEIQALLSDFFTARRGK